MLSRWFSRAPVIFGETERTAPFADAKPVTLLTGYLGSGKTSLLNALLRDPRLADSAVIVNEFGTVALDHELVHAGRERYVITSTGCLCCTATSDIRASLFELHEAARQRALPDFSRVIVETTGLADPAPIVNSLIPGGAPASGLRDHMVARRFRLAGVVATLDATCGEDMLSQSLEGWKQLAFADDIVLTKTDLIETSFGETGPSETSRAAWRAHLDRINPSARLHDRHDPDFNLATLCGSGSYDLAGKPEDVTGWLAMENLAGHRHDHNHHHSHDHGHHHGHDHGHHDHDPNRHGGILALPFVHDAPLDPRAVKRVLGILTNLPQIGLLRLKGLLALADDPGRPLLVHAVQHKLYPPRRLDYWPSLDMRSRLMLIGRNVSADPVRELLDLMIPRAARKRRSNRFR